MSFQISEIDIQNRVRELAKEIYEYYKSKDLCEINFIFITTSSFIFASDLIRALSGFKIKIISEHISIRSYSGLKSLEVDLSEVELNRLNLDGKVILIVDDILDTGKTLNFLKRKIYERYKPLMIDFCCLMRKTGINRNLDFKIKFIGFEIPNVFVVGYGLDYNGFYREQPFIRELKTL